MRPSELTGVAENRILAGENDTGKTAEKPTQPINI
jgi:hypothetical protein